MYQWGAGYGLILAIVLIVVVLIIAALFGCFSGKDAKKGDCNVSARFAATVAGAQEVPPVASGAQGSGQATLSDDQKTVRYNFTVSGLTGAPTEAHFHIGAPGQNGPVAKTLCRVSGGCGGGIVSYGGTWSACDATQPLTQADVNALLAGNVYFNVHSAAYPNGEARGQLRRLLTDA
jgi:hypothetical protein